LNSFAFDCLNCRFPFQILQQTESLPFYQLTFLELNCSFPVQSSCALLLSLPNLHTLKLVTFEQPDYFFHDLCCSRFYFQRNSLNESFDVDNTRSKRRKISTESHQTSNNVSNPPLQGTFSLFFEVSFLVFWFHNVCFLFLRTVCSYSIASFQIQDWNTLRTKNC
jgi:hypothetical protein